MFSLLITIIAIALVAALAVATIYYGGPAFEKGSTRANAATLSTQGQQILGAAQLFRADTGRWPTSLDEMVSASYLKAIPRPPAVTAASTWLTIQPTVPYYWVHRKVPENECRELNLLTRGDNGIFNAAKPSLATQCFGTAANYTAIIGIAGNAGSYSLADAIATADPTLQVDESGNGYAVPVTVTGSGGASGGGSNTGGTGGASSGGSGSDTGGGGGGGGTAVTPTYGSFTISPKDVNSPAFTLTPPSSSNSTGTFTYESSNPAVASVSGNVVTIRGAGSTTISAIQAASPGFTSGRTSAELTVSSGTAVTPTYGTFTVPAKKVGDPAFTLTAPSSTNTTGTFTYSSSNPAVASINGNVVTVHAAGTSTIYAIQAASPGYKSGGTSAVLTVTQALETPTITTPFTIPTLKLEYGVYQLTAPVSNSPGTWYFSSSDSSLATVSGRTLTLKGKGSAVITATQGAAPGFTGTYTTAPLVIEGREWRVAYQAAPWSSTCGSGWRKGTSAELLELYNMPYSTGYYSGWVWTSDVKNGYHVIVNMRDGRVSSDYDFVQYAIMCTRD